MSYAAQESHDLIYGHFSRGSPQISLTPGSTPENAVMAFQWVKRTTSPISAISWGAREGPTPFIAMTTGYSGRRAAFGEVVFWEYEDQFPCCPMDFFRFCSAEVVSLTVAPFLIMLTKGIEGYLTNTVHMPVSGSKIRLFLVDVRPGRTVKVSIDAGIGLVKKSNQIVLHGAEQCIHPGSWKNEGTWESSKIWNRYLWAHRLFFSRCYRSLSTCYPIFVKNVKKLLTIGTTWIILFKQSRLRNTRGTGYGVLAQLGEHLPYKQRVTGSSPVGPIWSN